MVFRQISEIALDGVNADLRMRIEAARNRGSDMRASARPATGKGGDQSCAGEDGEPVAYAQAGGNAAQTGMKSGGATEFSPTELLPLWKTPQGGARLGRVRKALSEVATVATAATMGSPRPSAVVISLNAWKAAHRHAANSTGRRAG